VTRWGLFTLKVEDVVTTTRKRRQAFISSIQNLEEHLFEYWPLVICLHSFLQQREKSFQSKSEHLKQCGAFKPTQLPLQLPLTQYKTQSRIAREGPFFRMSTQANFEAKGYYEMIQWFTYSSVKSRGGSDTSGTVTRCTIIYQKLCYWVTSVAFRNLYDHWRIRLGTGYPCPEILQQEIQKITSGKTICPSPNFCLFRVLHIMLRSSIHLAIQINAIVTRCCVHINYVQLLWINVNKRK
jgi:hypothetical protein